MNTMKKDAFWISEFLDYNHRRIEEDRARLICSWMYPTPWQFFWPRCIDAARILLNKPLP